MPNAGRYASLAFSNLYLNGPDKIRTCDLVLIRPIMKNAENSENHRVFRSLSTFAFFAIVLTYSHF